MQVLGLRQIILFLMRLQRLVHLDKNVPRKFFSDEGTSSAFYSTCMAQNTPLDEEDMSHY